MARSKNLQIGFIAAGMIANAHMRSFHEDRRTEVRALADISRKARDAMAPNTGFR